MPNKLFLLKRLVAVDVNFHVTHENEERLMIRHKFFASNQHRLVLGAPHLSTERPGTVL